VERTKKRVKRTPNKKTTHYISILHRREKAQTDAQTGTEITSEEEEIEFSDYGVARVIAKIIAFMGWIMFVLGFVVIGYAAVHIDGTKNIDVILVIVLPGIGMIITGLFLIVAGQITRATVNNASHTKQILLHLRRH